MSQTNPTKRIPKALGTETKLFGAYSITDLAVALLPGVLVVLVVQLLIPASISILGYSAQALTLPLAGAAILVGALFVFLTPTYTSSLDWVATFATYLRRRKELPHDAAKRYTQIERVHAAERAIERTDGTYLAFVQVTPPAMALATDEQWAETAAAFKDFCNTTVQFPIQLYSTTQPFPVEEYLSTYTERLEDSDVRENPRLAALIEEYIAWYATDLDERRMTIRDHYVIVEVSPRDVQFDRESLLEQLASLPLFGLFIAARYASRAEEQHAAMFETLDERARAVEVGLREIDGCDAQRIDAETAIEVIGEYWAGESREYGDLGSKLRRAPIVRGSE